MKTICAALGMAALLTFSASADTLTLPKGQVLDFGDTVDVLDGSQTYFGKQMKDWAEHEKVEKTSKRQAAAGIIGSVDSPAAVYLESKLTPDVSRLAAKAWEELRIYQLRANTPEAFYESLVLSFSVDHKNSGKEKNGLLPFVKLMGKEMTDTAGKRTADVKMGKTVKAEKDIFPKMWKEAKIKNSYKRFLEKKGIRLYTSDVTRWKEKKSSGGKAYRLAKAKIGLSYDGYLFPLFAEGLIVDDGTATTYTLFVGDQKSGSYFAPCIEKAAGRMK